MLKSIGTNRNSYMICLVIECLFVFSFTRWSYGILLWEIATLGMILIKGCNLKIYYIPMCDFIEHNLLSELRLFKIIKFVGLIRL